MARSTLGADAFVCILAVRSRWGAKEGHQPGGKEASKILSIQHKYTAMEI